MEKSVACGRCSRIFAGESKLKQHLSSDVPCDFLCTKCGVKLKCKRTYYNHKSNKCIPKQGVFIDTLNITSNTIQVNNGTMNNNTTNNTNVFKQNNSQSHTHIHFPPIVYFDSGNTKYAREYGILPHEVEQEELWKYHKMTILNMLYDYMLKTGDDCVNKEDFYKMLVLQLVQLFYSNVAYPHHINIKDGNPDSNYNEVYSGEEFVKDGMTKSMRNRRIIQTLIVVMMTLTNDKGVPEPIKKFVNQNFLPYILNTCYLTKINEDSMQQIWRYNNDLISILMKQYEIPPYSFLNEVTFDVVQQAKMYEGINNVCLQLINARNKFDVQNEVNNVVNGYLK